MSSSVRPCRIFDRPPSNCARSRSKADQIGSALQNLDPTAKLRRQAEAHIDKMTSAVARGVRRNEVEAAGRSLHVPIKRRPRLGRRGLHQVGSWIGMGPGPTISVCRLIFCGIVATTILRQQCPNLSGQFMKCRAATACVREGHLRSLRTRPDTSTTCPR